MGCEHVSFTFLKGTPVWCVKPNTPLRMTMPSPQRKDLLLTLLAKDQAEPRLLLGENIRSLGKLSQGVPLRLRIQQTPGAKPGKVM